MNKSGYSTKKEEEHDDKFSYGPRVPVVWVVWTRIGGAAPTANLASRPVVARACSRASQVRDFLALLVAPGAWPNRRRRPRAQPFGFHGPSQLPADFACSCLSALMQPCNLCANHSGQDHADVPTGSNHMCIKKGARGRGNDDQSQQISKPVKRNWRSLALVAGARVTWMCRFRVLEDLHCTAAFGRCVHPHGF